MPAIAETLKHTVIQFAAVFGVFIAGGLSLTWLARLTNNAFRQFMFPNFGLYFFGSVGVPVHEFSHALFCKVFFHKVQKIKWFDPEARGGSHGAVTHLYSPTNIYHRIGHFFIGFGPVILGPLVLALLFRFLVPGAERAFSVASLSYDGALVKSTFSMFFTSLFTKANLHAPGFYIFLYLAAAISSQLELSPEDLKQARTGVWVLLLLLLAVNTVATILRANWHGTAIVAGLGVLTFWGCLFVFTALISIGTLLVTTLLFSLVNGLFGREPVNPFRS
jgi:hypothetical protein